MDELPRFVEEISKKYQLSTLRPLKNLTYHYVLSGYQKSQPIVLKLGLDYGSMEREAVALKAFEGYGVVKLLASEKGVLLLERIVPGTSLKSYFPTQEDKSISIVCAVMERLHQSPLPSTGTFSAVEDWLQNLDKDWSISLRYLEQARTLRDKLLATTSVPFRLLHGDLHHENILQSDSGWIAIDPKGIVGEIGYEVAKFIRNPLEEVTAHPNAAEIIEHRIHSFAKLLKQNPKRLKDWCLVQSVLAWTWAIEDGVEEENFRKSAELFSKL